MKLAKQARTTATTTMAQRTSEKHESKHLFLFSTHVLLGQLFTLSVNSTTFFDEFKEEKTFCTFRILMMKNQQPEKKTVAVEYQCDTDKIFWVCAHNVCTFKSKKVEKKKMCADDEKKHINRNRRRREKE